MASFLDEVNEKSGTRAERCYQCRKCAAGCPMASAMDAPPNKILRMVQLGRRAEVLASSAIWLCASCDTCSARCPNQVDIPRVMDALRGMSIAQGTVAEKNVLRFHEAFLASVRRGGRVNEPTMLIHYKLKSKDFFSDVKTGLGMLRKGKLSFRSPKTRNLASVKRIFERTEPGRGE
ncbi:MAG: 4Fe-4S dicluster domain-containing protein [Deltaproteobacteria bacterium]|nr:4Fe-4S dicluster domain-containing protein [Deltaproteobacteria bacterium]